MKKWQFLVLLVAAVVAYSSSANADPCGSYYDCGQNASGDYGCALTSPFMTVTPYSNGNWMEGPCGEYQCVEYVKRLYSDPEAINVSTSTWSGNGGQYYSTAAAKGLVAFQNGSVTEPPQPGDILCYSGGSYGHVAVVKGGNESVVETIEQNWSPTGLFDLSMTKNANGTYTITSRGSYVVQGWLREPDYVPAEVITKFADVVSRNGGSSYVGTGGIIYWYGPYFRQDFSSGSFGDCCIMYDPSNYIGNPDATDEAYLLRTGFNEYYFDGDGWEEFGCPSRDEYHPETGAEGDAIQFFVKRVAGETQFHYMYFQDDGDIITWHSAYAIDYVSQNPAGQFTMQQGETKTFTVSFQNESQFTWHNNSGSYPYDYVELKSCDANGATCESFLNYPYSGSLGWLNNISPCTMQESSVAPGEVATFTFTGKVDASASLGLHLVYFRVNHSVGGLMTDWGGMHFQVYVVPPIVQGYADIAFIHQDATDVTSIHMLLSDGGDFWYQGSQGWYQSTDIDGIVVASVAADFTGDNITDIAEVLDFGYQVGDYYLTKVFVYRNTGSSFTKETWWVPGNYNAQKVVGAAGGDFNNDGYDDLMLVYDYGLQGDGTYLSRAHGLVSNGSSFSYSFWWSSGNYNAQKIVGVSAGDLNNDTKSDLVLVYDYGLQPNQTYLTRVHGLVSTGSGLTFSYWWSSGNYNAQNIVGVTCGKYNNDGYDDVALVYDHGTQPNGTKLMRIHGLMSNGSSLSFSYWYSSGNYNAQNIKFAASRDFDYDGHDDIALAYASGSTTTLHTFLSDGSSFTLDGGSWSWWRDTNYPLDEGVGMVAGFFNEAYHPVPKAGFTDDNSSALPVQFTLNQNYPNPFNPQTTISYTLPVATNVRLDIFNILGQRVATLVDEHQSAGEHTVLWTSEGLSSGIYFYRFASGVATETKKMLLLK